LTKGACTPLVHTCFAVRAKNFIIMVALPTLDERLIESLKPIFTRRICSREAKRKTILANVIGQRKNSPRKSWIGSYFSTVRANNRL
jgi:hypothetical protein